MNKPETAFADSSEKRHDDTVLWWLRNPHTALGRAASSYRPAGRFSPTLPLAVRGRSTPDRIALSRSKDDGRRRSPAQRRHVSTRCRFSIVEYRNVLDPSRRHVAFERLTYNEALNRIQPISPCFRCRNPGVRKQITDFTGAARPLRSRPGSTRLRLPEPRNASRPTGNDPCRKRLREKGRGAARGQAGKPGTASMLAPASWRSVASSGHRPGDWRHQRQCRASDPRCRDGMVLVSLPSSGECSTIIAAVIGRPVPRSDICHAAGESRRGTANGSDITAVETGQGTGTDVAMNWRAGQGLSLGRFARRPDPSSMAFLSRTAVAQQPRLSGPCCLSSPALRCSAGPGDRLPAPPLKSGFPSRLRARCRATTARLLTQAIDGAGPR